MGEAVELHVAEVGPGHVVPPDQVLTEALTKYETLVLVGETADGEIQVCASHHTGEALILLMWAQNFLVQNRTVRA